MPSGIYGSLPANSLIFPNSALNISFTSCLIVNLALLWDPLMWWLFFPPIFLEILGLEAKRIGVLLASPPCHSLFLLPKVSDFELHITCQPFTSYCNRTPEFNSWLTVTLFHTVTV